MVTDKAMLNEQIHIEHKEESIPVPREKCLELENMHLKIQIAKNNVTMMEKDFQTSIKQVFLDAGVTTDDYGLDINKGVIIRK